MGEDERGFDADFEKTHWMHHAHRLMRRRMRNRIDGVECKLVSACDKRRETHLLEHIRSCEYEGDSCVGRLTIVDEITPSAEN